MDFCTIDSEHMNRVVGGAPPGSTQAAAERVIAGQDEIARIQRECGPLVDQRERARSAQNAFIKIVTRKSEWEAQMKVDAWDRAVKACELGQPVTTPQ